MFSLNFHIEQVDASLLSSKLVGKVKPAKRMIDFEQWWSKDFQFKKAKIKNKNNLNMLIDHKLTIKNK